MKYNSGDKLYFVCPFVFTIEKVAVDMGYIGEDGFIYYIDHDTGAELAEHVLFEELAEAVANAENMLNKFYELKQQEINSHKPQSGIKEDEIEQRRRLA